MKRLFDWLDNRTGYREIVHQALYENIPGGSRWRYVWGRTLLFCLGVQFITGFCLWIAYNPSSQTAWESVYFIQYEMTGGWLLRGIHHHAASVMNVLLVLHFMQIVIDGAYKAPREVNFWVGLVLMQLVLALSWTGYLLPWDQRGYWATKVAANIAATVPVIGLDIQKLIIGGSEYGHHTLSRFFALHAGVLPALVVALIALHLYLFRRHGITAKNPKTKSDACFWPDQALKDAVACLAVMAAILVLVIRPWFFGDEVGAELGAPADLSEGYSAARPEWYFLFLFEFLKFFPGETEIWGAIVIPGLVMVVIFFMPIIGNWKLGHRFNVGLVFSLLIGVAFLTFLSIAHDIREPEYQTAVLEAKHNAERVKVLASAPTGIPLSGAVTLLRNDPLTRGPKLFAEHCASCHRYDGHNGEGLLVNEEPAASDLRGFASREWLAGLLDPEQIDGVHYFGATKFKDTKMSRFVKRDVAKYSDEEKEQLEKVIMAVSAEASLNSQASVDERDVELIVEGRRLIDEVDISCADCHEFRFEDEDATAPELTGYGSREWLISFISDPADDRYYGNRNDRMPSFGKDGILETGDIALLADWLRGDWFVPAAEGSRVRVSAIEGDQ